MPIASSRPRSGRLLDILVVSVCLFVLLGLALYHYRRIDREQADPGKIKELSERKFDAPARSATHDWPHWRGPNYDGVSREIDILTDWPKEGPKVLWQAKTGEGFATVVVSKGRVFTLIQDGPNEAVVCWDAETGKEEWRFAYECRYTNDYGNGPRATPTVDGDLVFVVGGTGSMHCLKTNPANAAGEVVWQKDLQKEFGAPVPKWGIAFSPLVVGERVFIVPGGPDGNAIAALDRKSGATLWKKYDDLAGYASPTPATFAGQQQILVLTGSRLVSVQPEDGKLLWEYPWATENQCNIASPLVVEDYVFLSSYYGRGCAVLKIGKTGEQWTCDLVYKNLRMRNHIGTSVFHKGYLYGFDDSIIKCLDFRTGALQRAWGVRNFDKGSLALANNHLIIYGANGTLALAEANPEEYVEKARFQFSTQTSCWSPPVIANGRLYVRDREKLVCFDVRAKK